MTDATLSPHQDLAERLSLAIKSWDSVPEGFQVERSYGIEKYLSNWIDLVPGRIVVIVSAVESQRVGPVNQDDVTLSIGYLRKVDPTGSISEMDGCDIAADQLRTFLQSETVRNISLPDWETGARRINTTLPTPYSSELAKTNSIFAAIIQSAYRILRMNAT